MGYGEQLERRSFSLCRINAPRALRIGEACRYVSFDVFELSCTSAAIILATGAKAANVSLGPKTFLDILRTNGCPLHQSVKNLVDPSVSLRCIP